MRTIYDPTHLGLQIAKVMGDEVQVFCPYHSDSHPSAEYNLAKGLFYCFGCATSKTARQLMDDLGGSLVPLKELPEGFGLVDRDELTWLPLLYNPLAYDSDYLAKRGVDHKQIADHGIRLSKDGIIFPIKDKFWTDIGVQVRYFTRQPKYMFHGERTPVWPITELLHIRDRVFITEGIFGALRGEKSLVPTLAMMGAGSVHHVAKFLNGQRQLNPIAIMDDDYAGYLAAGKFILNGIPALLAPWRGCPDDWTQGQWDEAVRHQYDYSTLDVYHVIEKSDRPEQMEKTLEKYWRKL